MVDLPTISVIVPTFNESEHINNCIESILNQDYPKRITEVFFVDGMSTDDTKVIIEKYTEKFEFLKLVSNNNKYVSFALNEGIRLSKGDIVIRLDAHCKYPKNYFSTLVTNLISLNADNVGCILKTRPANNSNICNAIAIGTSHKFGVGDSLFRVGVSKIQRADTVPFGCFKKKIFAEIGLFDTDLVRNQDDEFNSRIIKNGGKIFIIPHISIDYYARESLSKVANMFYQYGLFKPLVNKKIGVPATVRQIFPLFFIIGLIGGGILSVLSNIILILYISVLFFYLTISLFIAITRSIKDKNFTMIYLLPTVFIILHTSYGIGYLAGIYRFVIMNRGSVKVKTNR